jgi:hypothetical protein
MMLGLTNNELEKMSKKILGETFLGVYPSNVKPGITKYNNFSTKYNNFSLIFNLSKHNEKGTHFVAVVIKNKTVFYFDSYGKPCENENILNFLNQLSPVYFYNKFSIQADNSIFCGIFCLGFLLSCQKLNLTPEKFINLFTYKSTENDQIATNFIVRNLK